MMLSVTSMSFGDSVAVSSPEFSDLATNFRAAGIWGIELVPALEWGGWDGATVAAASRLRNRMADEGMACPAFQSILFGIDGAALFAGGDDGRKILGDHVVRVAGLAEVLGAGALVFGSPGLRKRGSLSMEEATAVAAEFFRNVAERIAPTGVALCIEPNAKGYGCDFVTSMAEGDALVQAVGHPSFALHFDTGSSRMEDASPAAEVAKFSGRFRHMHASEPLLAPFDLEGTVDHPAVARVLEGSGYGGWTSLEMKKADLATVVRCASAFGNAYGGQPSPSISARHP